ncbi:hypothetical protein ACFVWN_01345 [Nocardiopsis flavescens]|uniref:hypothetical protein n=1 Tax=Nocardiopsis flavescens TaxID=758803 RepID=UPI003666A671
MPDSIDHRLKLLSVDSVRAATLLVAHPGPHASRDLAAALWEASPSQAVATLDILTVARVLTEVKPDQYALPSPVRAALLHRITEAEQAQTVDRAARFYRMRVAAADQVLNVWRWRVDEEGVREAAQAQRDEARTWFSDQAAAMAWLDEEIDTIVAVVRGLDNDRRAETWCIAEHIATYINHRKPWQVAAELYRYGLNAALACDDEVASALMHQRCAVITNDLAERRAHLDAALDAFRNAGHPEGVCSAEQALADHLSQTGERAVAEELYTASLAGHLVLGRTRGAAITQRKRGELRALLGRSMAAAVDFTAAHRILLDLEVPDTYQATRAVQGLLRLLTLSALEPFAVQLLEMLAHQTLHQARRDGAIHEQSGLLNYLAVLAGMRGDDERARALRERSWELMAPTGHPGSSDRP